MGPRSVPARRAPVGASGWLRSTAAAIGAAFTWAGGKASGALSLIAPYLARLLWLIDTKWLDLARQGFGANATVFACIRLLMKSICEPPLRAYTEAADGELSPLPAAHPLAALIKRPNALMTEAHFHQVVKSYEAIGGRALVWKERDNVGRLLALWPLRPDRVGPIYSDEAAGDGRVLLGWSYLVPGTSKYLPLPRADVAMFLVSPDPAGESGGIVEGIGPLQALATEVSADNAASRFVGSLIANYAMPGALLTTKTPIRSPDDAKLLKAAFMEQFGGVRRGEPMVMDAEAGVTILGFNLHELEFPDLRDVSESRICGAFGVPPILVYARVGLKSGIKATIDEQRRQFTENELCPTWRAYGDVWTGDIAAEYGEGIVCRYDLTKVRGLADVNAKEREPVAAAYQAGALTVNEYRHVLGYPPLDDGDLRLWPMAMGNPEQFIDEGEDAADELAEGVEEDEDGTTARRKPAPKQQAAAPAAGTKPPAGRAVRSRHATRALPAGPAHPDQYHAAILRARVRLGSAMSHDLTHFLSAQRDRAIERIGATQAPAGAWGRAADVPNAETLLPSDETQRLRDELAPWYGRMLTAVQGATEDALGISFDLDDPATRAYLAGAGEYAGDIDATTRAAIRDAIVEGHAAGEGMDQIARRIRDLTEWKRHRAVTVARTELGRASNLAAMASFRASGVVVGVRFYDGDKDAPCADVAGKTMSMEDADNVPALFHPRCTQARSPITDPDELEAA